MNSIVSLPFSFISTFQQVPNTHNVIPLIFTQRFTDNGAIFIRTVLPNPHPNSIRAFNPSSSPDFTNCVCVCVCKKGFFPLP